MLRGRSDSAAQFHKIGVTSLSGPSVIAYGLAGRAGEWRSLRNNTRNACPDHLHYAAYLQFSSSTLSGHSNLTLPGVERTSRLILLYACLFLYPQLGLTKTWIVFHGTLEGTHHANLKKKYIPCWNSLLSISSFASTEREWVDGQAYALRLERTLQRSPAPPPWTSWSSMPSCKLEGRARQNTRGRVTRVNERPVRSRVSSGDEHGQHAPGRHAHRDQCRLPRFL